MMGGWPDAAQWGPGWMTGGWPDAAQWGPGWMMGRFDWNGAGWTGPTYQGNQMPMFYASRLGQMMVPANGVWGRRSFTDPALALGGGVRIDLSDKVYVRPDARALLVVGGGDTYTIGSVSVGVGYRF
jgi:hypothetical protein